MTAIHRDRYYFGTPPNLGQRTRIALTTSLRTGKFASLVTNHNFPSGIRLVRQFGSRRRVQQPTADDRRRHDRRRRDQVGGVLEADSGAGRGHQSTTGADRGPETSTGDAAGGRRRARCSWQHVAAVVATSSLPRTRASARGKVEHPVRHRGGAAHRCLPMSA